VSQPFNPTNVPGTCLWCGRKLIQRWRWDVTWEGGSPRNVPGTRRKQMDKPGAYGDGYFCGLTCGYEFGKALAHFGRRLIRKDTPQEGQR